MENETTIGQLSDMLADAASAAARSVVRVDDGTHMTASGVVWRVENGAAWVVATSHGVERDDALTVAGADGTARAAKAAGRDADTDIALLFVPDAGDLTPISLAPDDSVRVGNVVLAVARPGEEGLHATMGIIGTRRDTQTGDVPEYILQTDATLFPGFSGGALVDVHGRMAGLLNRMFGRGMGVALGSPMVNRVAEQLMESGAVRRGYLGLRMQLVNLPAGVADARGQVRGLLVIHVEAGSPAEGAGLLLGDTLLSANGVNLGDVDALRPYLRAGSSVTLTLLRGGETREITTTVGTLPE